ncbi:MAG: hypothetical protein IPJ77_06280 [Planctomycetes bacterium]|nr:hypothetical protein [Planctomycetota bacterium]
MIHDRSDRRDRARRSLFVLALALLTLGFACALAGREDGARVPPQTWNAARGPVVPHDRFPADCSLCHEGTSWNRIKRDFQFDHAKETGVALAGAHARAECLRCHNDRGSVATFAAQGCSGCHEDVHRARLGANCTDCHDEHDWNPRGQIAQHNRTRFPLVGAHAAVACERCHAGAAAANFDATSTRCEDCHQEDLARATSPDHAMQGWTSACDRCHIPTDWVGAAFNHPAFPLTGAHAGLACSACHAGNDYGNAPNTCVGCHQSEYDATTDPPHAAAGFPTACQTCHSTSAWRPASFDHSSFRLTGAHATIDCSACHAGGVYQGLPTACAACHQDDYDGTTDPNHSAAGFPTSCQTCHGTNTWEGATFAHTQFPITSGAHQGLACAQCHLNRSNYGTFSCTDCHEHRQSATDPDHDRVSNYVYQSQACYSCHPNGHADD